MTADVTILLPRPHRKSPVRCGRDLYSITIFTIDEDINAQGSLPD
jgi:hypothetical protein